MPPTRSPPARFVFFAAFNPSGLGMKNWLRKTRRRDKVEFILPGSGVAFKKWRHVNVMGLAYILAPRSRKSKSADQKMRASNRGRGHDRGSAASS